MSGTYKVVFRGDILPGQSLAEVRTRLGELFKLDEAGLNKLFCGRPVTLKRNLDATAAGKWCEALQRAGAVAESRPEDPDQGGAPPVAAASYGFDLAPVGADVLKPNERRAPEGPAVVVPPLQVAEVGADVLKPEERRTFAELDLDLSHITLE